MPSIAGIVGQLAAAPKPVICLDTCDILDVVQCLGLGKGNRRAEYGLRSSRAPTAYNARRLS
jgi:hypothetical protein